MKSRSHEIGCYNDHIALKFDRHLGSAAAEMSVKFQSDWKSSIRISWLRVFARSCGKTSYRLMNRCPGWLQSHIILTLSHCQSSTNRNALLKLLPGSLVETIRKSMKIPVSRWTTRAIWNLWACVFSPHRMHGHLHVVIFSKGCLCLVS